MGDWFGMVCSLKFLSEGASWNISDFNNDN